MVQFLRFRWIVRHGPVLVEAGHHSVEVPQLLEILYIL